MNASRPRTWQPSASRRSHKWEPMKPAAPVTRQSMSRSPIKEARSEEQARMLTERGSQNKSGVPSVLSKARAPAAQILRQAIRIIRRQAVHAPCQETLCECRVVGRPRQHAHPARVSRLYLPRVQKKIIWTIYGCFCSLDNLRRIDERRLGDENASL